MLHAIDAAKGRQEKALHANSPDGDLMGRWRDADEALLVLCSVTKLFSPLEFLELYHCHHYWRLLQGDYWRLLETYEYHMIHKKQQNISTLFLSCSTKHKHLSQVKGIHCAFQSIVRITNVIGKSWNILEHLSLCRVCRVCRVCHAFSFS